MTQLHDVVADLKWRGLLNQVTDEHIGEFFLKKRRTIYTGFDPTGPSLHVGHLVAIMNLPPFIATLCTMLLTRGFGSILSSPMSSCEKPSQRMSASSSFSAERYARALRCCAFAVSPKARPLSPSSASTQRIGMPQS